MQKKRGCTQTELLLEQKQTCDTDKNQASDEDMQVGCLTRVTACEFICHVSKRPCH